MTENIFILTDELRSINAEMNNLIAKINDNMAVIKDNINYLTSKDIWIGKSSENYQDKYANIISNYEELYTELKNSISYINNVCQVYDDIGSNVDSLIFGGI